VCNSSIRSSCLAPVAAEAMAVLLAIQLCRELGFLRVHLEGDAKGVIDTVNYVDVDKC
jgi:ribonuclease HI